MNRRQFSKNIVSLTVFGGGAYTLLAGCGTKPKGLVCSDTSGLAASDAAMRNTLKYVDQSVDANKLCSGCQFYLPKATDACGGCQLVKGPIHPKGYCTSWIAKKT